MNTLLLLAVPSASYSCSSSNSPTPFPLLLLLSLSVLLELGNSGTLWCLFLLQPGLFRSSMRQQAMWVIVECLDEGLDVPPSADPSNVLRVLRLFLSCLPEPIIPHKLYQRCVDNSLNKLLSTKVGDGGTLRHARTQSDDEIRGVIGNHKKKKERERAMCARKGGRKEDQQKNSLVDGNPSFFFWLPTPPLAYMDR